MKLVSVMRHSLMLLIRYSSTFICGVRNVYFYRCEDAIVWSGLGLLLPFGRTSLLNMMRLLTRFLVWKYSLVLLTRYFRDIFLLVHSLRFFINGRWVFACGIFPVTFYSVHLPGRRWAMKPILAGLLTVALVSVKTKLLAVTSSR